MNAPAAGVLRTPDERFANLKDFPFTPHYRMVGDNLRMHYLDEGPRDGPVVLLLHGEPTWAYLYRTMIPTLTGAGLRVIVPDLIGFGRSDKPVRITDYTYAKHVAWVLDLIDQLTLNNMTLFGQDWGSLIGLRLVAEHPDRFARVMISNGFLPTGELGGNSAFKIWRAFARWSPWFPIGKIVNTGCVTKLSSEEIAAYDAPFPDDRYKAGTRAFPGLVPISMDNPAAAANSAAWKALGQWTKPFLCVFGKNDPILGRADKPLIAHIPGTAGQPHERTWGGHFVQEDRGEFLAHKLVSFISTAPRYA